VHSKQLKRKSNIEGICAWFRAVRGNKTENEENLWQTQDASRATKRLWTGSEPSLRHNTWRITFRFPGVALVFTSFLLYYSYCAFFLYSVCWPTGALKMYNKIQFKIHIAWSFCTGLPSSGILRTPRITSQTCMAVNTWSGVLVLWAFCS
jgi:hypothetical protein